jgi:hypothetical protein
LRPVDYRQELVAQHVAEDSVRLVHQVVHELALHALKRREVDCFRAVGFHAVGPIVLVPSGVLDINEPVVAGPQPAQNVAGRGMRDAAFLAGPQVAHVDVEAPLPGS